MCFCFSLDQRKVDSARVDREMAQLRKVTRKKDNQIKSLQSDARRRELVLKRRQEEVWIGLVSPTISVHLHNVLCVYALVFVYHAYYLSLYVHYFVLVACSS